VFGARMAVELVNDGPVTLLLEVWREARAAARGRVFASWSCLSA